MVFHVVESGRVVAVAIVYQISARVWQLEYLAVLPECQSRGYGRLLIQAVVSRYRRVSLDCESPLIPYYMKFGFRPLNRWLYYRSTATCVMICGDVTFSERNHVYTNLSGVHVDTVNSPEKCRFHCRRNDKIPP